jgi:hypothetical protein
MNILFKSIPLLFLLSFISVSAQYTETINSNRPGASQGAFSVGKKVIQIETGIGIGSEEHILQNTETNVFLLEYDIRYGFWKEELEFSLMGAYQSNSITYSPEGGIPADFKESNFTHNRLGAKYLVYDPYRKREQRGPNLYSWKANNKFQWADLIPAVSVYAGANFDTSNNPFIPGSESSISPTVVISTQNNWLGGWVFVTNIIADRFTEDVPSYSYILTLTHAFNPVFSAFIENQGIKSDFYADQLLRGGAAYLFSKDFQVDASLMVNFKDTPSRLYGRLGISYRFDMHKQDEFIEDKGKTGRKKRKEDKVLKKSQKKSQKKKKRRKN